jgi:hemoglobin
MMDELDRAAIERMVDDFYARVRRDPRLGPIFEARVHGRWPAHLGRMVQFWSAALLREPGYSGNPRAIHARLDGVDPSHFRRWLELFAETLDDLFAPPLAEEIHRRARAMAGGLLSARGYGRHHLQLRPGDPR